MGADERRGAGWVRDLGKNYIVSNESKNSNWSDVEQILWTLRGTPGWAYGSLESQNWVGDRWIISSELHIAFTNVMKFKM